MGLGKQGGELMACGACGGRKPANTEYLLTYRDGTQERVATLGEARLKLARSAGGGTKQLVPKLSK